MRQLIKTKAKTKTKTNQGHVKLNCFNFRQKRPSWVHDNHCYLTINPSVCAGSSQCVVFRKRQAGSFPNPKLSNKKGEIVQIMQNVVLPASGGHDNMRLLFAKYNTNVPFHPPPTPPASCLSHLAQSRCDNRISLTWLSTINICSWHWLSSSFNSSLLVLWPSWLSRRMPTSSWTSCKTMLSLSKISPWPCNADARWNITRIANALPCHSSSQCSRIVVLKCQKCHQFHKESQVLRVTACILLLLLA